MSSQYERIGDDCDNDEYPERPEIFFMRASNRRGQRWPRATGIVQIVIGIIIACLGTLEVFIVPIIENHTAAIQFNKHTCWGAGMFAGVVMVLTGSTAVRASVSKRKTTMYRFYNLTVLAFLVYVFFTGMVIYSYAKGWNASDAYPPHSAMYEVHMFVTICMVLGLMFALTPLVQYYDVVCCGEMKLWERWINCLCSLCLAKRQAFNPTGSQESVNSTPPGLLI